MTSKEGKFIFRGEKGESIFTRPFEMGPSGIVDYNAEMPELFKKIDKESGNDRAFAITVALVIEHNIDRFLGILIPGYVKLIKDNERDISFSLKIELLRSFKIVPGHILRCADAVRKVRNDFGHHLDLDSFEKLYKDSRNNILTTLYYESYRKPESGEKSIKELFRGIAFIAAGIRSYESNVNVLREIIQSDRFLEKLELYSKIKVLKEEKKLMELGSIETKIQNSSKEIRFQKGIAYIGPYEKEIKEIINESDNYIKELEQKLLKESIFDI